MLAVAEALSAIGRRARLELIRGSLSGNEARRAASVGLEWSTLAPRATGSHGAVLVDLPDPNEVTTWFDPADLAVMDDRDAFAGEAAVVVQPSQAAWSGPGRAARILAGYPYVPLAAVFRELRVRTRRASPAGSPLHVVACFGGSDPARVGERLAPALGPGEGWTSELILGADYAGAAERGSVRLIRDPRDLPQRLAAADLVVLGAGTMKFEAACVGRPAILVAVADDQLAVGPPFAATGAAVFVGDGRTIEPGAVRAAIETLIEDDDRRALIGGTAAALIDGRGAERIAAALVEVAASSRR